MIEDLIGKMDKLSIEMISKHDFVSHKGKKVKNVYLTSIFSSR